MASREEILAIVNVMQAKLDGKQTQYKDWSGLGWQDMYKGDWHFNYEQIEYRIKPEPREIFANEHPGGSICCHRTLAGAQTHRTDGGVTAIYREVINDE